MDSEKQQDFVDKLLKEALNDIRSISLADEKEVLRKSATENLAIVLMYASGKRLLENSENLAKHSKVLTCWTIVIAVFTIVLGLSTIWDILEKYWL